MGSASSIQEVLLLHGGDDRHQLLERLAQLHIVREREPDHGQHVERHEELHDEGLGPIHEDNKAMTGTYLMMDALGRFFSNKTGSHSYTDSILDVGMDAALVQLGWDIEGFIARQGIYEWRHSDVQSIVSDPVDVSNET